jgi:hypothetical protein
VAEKTILIGHHCHYLINVVRETKSKENNDLQKNCKEGGEDPTPLVTDEVSEGGGREAELAA